MGTSILLPRPASRTRLAALALATLSLVAGIGHAVAAVQHAYAGVISVAAFASLAAAQVAWAVWIASRGPSRLLLLAGVAGNLGATVAWMLSRTVGLPLIHGGVAEAAGALDSVVVLAQVLLVGGAAITAGGGFGLAAAMLATGLLMTPLAALAPPALADAHGHSGDAAHSHAPAPAQAPVTAERPKVKSKVNQAALDALMNHAGHAEGEPSYAIKPAAAKAPNKRPAKAAGHSHAPGTPAHED